MDRSPLAIEVVLIDDGSRDNTAVLMQQLALTDDRYHCVFLARNYGHQIALTAGMAAAKVPKRCSSSTATSRIRLSCWTNSTLNFRKATTSFMPFGRNGKRGH
jgi:hypothetical protein